MDPTNAGRSAAPCGPDRAAPHTISATARQVHVGPLGPAREAAGR